MEQTMEYYDLSVKRGESLEQDIGFYEVIDGVRTPISLAGVAPKAEIRPKPGSQKLLASFDCDMVAEEGKVMLNLSGEDTLKLNAGVYAWDLYMENASEDISKYPIGGMFTVYDHVTEP